MLSLEYYKASREGQTNSIVTQPNLQPCHLPPPPPLVINNDRFLTPMVYPHNGNTIPSYESQGPSLRCKQNNNLFSTIFRALKRISNVCATKHPQNDGWVFLLVKNCVQLFAYVQIHVKNKQTSQQRLTTENKIVFLSHPNCNFYINYL